MTALSATDRAAVVEQLGRESLTKFEVVARCHGGHPLAIRNHPLDREGKPFPTLYWLTCPVARRAVSHLESEGWIARLAEAWGGVGGTRRGLKCLHAHYANHLAGGDDPVGAWVADRVEPIHPGRAVERVAAVDVGTNSVRLLVAEPAGGGLQDVARDMVITRLGRAVDRTGRFDPEALDRTLDVVGRYVRRARALGARRFHVGATSATRDAANREDLLVAIRDLTGSSPEVLTGEREGHLSFLGATAELEAPAPFLVFDIGGGSTELILGADAPESAASVDVGSVRITERVAPSDPPHEEDLDRMRAEAAGALAPAEAAVPPGRARTLVGVAGTTTTVQALALGLDGYDPEAIHRSVLARADAERVAADLARMTVAERAALPVMAAGREDVIVAGALILVEILERWGAREALVSERDILDGLALEMVNAQETR